MLPCHPAHVTVDAVVAVVVACWVFYFLVPLPFLFSFFFSDGLGAIDVGARVRNAAVVAGQCCAFYFMC